MIPASILKKERGWTDGLIKKFLGEPDKLAVNPNYRTGPKMKLYALERIEEVEEIADVREALARAQESRGNRSLASKAVQDRKRQELLSAIEQLDITLPDIRLDELKSEAAKHYDRLWSARGQHEKSAYGEQSDLFIKRITCNFIRHQLIDYDAICECLRGRVGRHEAYVLLKGRVMGAIYAQYPELK